MLDVIGLGAIGFICITCFTIGFAIAVLIIIVVLLVFSVEHHNGVP